MVSGGTCTRTRTSKHARLVVSFCFAAGTSVPGTARGIPRLTSRRAGRSPRSCWSCRTGRCDPDRQGRVPSPSRCSVDPVHRYACSHHRATRPNLTGHRSRRHVDVSVRSGPAPSHGTVRCDPTGRTRPCSRAPPHIYARCLPYPARRSRSGHRLRLRPLTPLSPRRGSSVRRNTHLYVFRSAFAVSCLPGRVITDRALASSLPRPLAPSRCAIG